MRLEDKVAIIIGGGQAPGESAAIGNGRATALLFAREGAKVCSVDRSLESAQETADMIAKEGGTAIAAAADVTDESTIETAIKACANEWGRLDILHNNVGISVEGGDATLDKISMEAFERIFDVNLLGTMLACKHALPIMRDQKSGAIVNISSAGGISPGSSSIAYSSSKAGLNHLTRCLAVAMSPEVAVNCVAPGLVENTRMAKRLPEAVSNGARRQAILGRVGQTDDIAEQVLTFVTSTSVTGQTLVIDGGLPGAMR